MAGGSFSCARAPGPAREAGGSFFMPASEDCLFILALSMHWCGQLGHVGKNKILPDGFRCGAQSSELFADDGVPPVHALCTSAPRRDVCLSLSLSLSVCVFLCVCALCALCVCVCKFICACVRVCARSSLSRARSLSFLMSALLRVLEFS